jgi:hypothetical protein
MNLWKPTALVLTSALSMMIGYGVASARPAEQKPMSREWHMHNALEHLRIARVELELSEHNMDGWRVRAVESVDRAIWETRHAIDVYHP